jgi:hypothetical protein
MRAARSGARLLFAFHVLQPLSLLIALRIGIAPGLIAAPCGCARRRRVLLLRLLLGVRWLRRLGMSRLALLLAAIAGADAPAPMQAADNAVKVIWRIIFRFPPIFSLLGSPPRHSKGVTNA